MKFVKNTNVSFVRRNGQRIKGSVAKNTQEANGTWVHVTTKLGVIKARPSQLKTL